MKYIFGKTIQLKFPVCYFPLHLAPWCQSDCKTLILFFFLIAFVCFREVAASLIPSRKLITIYFEVSIHSQNVFLQMIILPTLELGTLLLDCWFHSNVCGVLAMCLCLYSSFPICVWTSLTFTGCKEGSGCVAGWSIEVTYLLSSKYHCSLWMHLPTGCSTVSPTQASTGTGDECCCCPRLPQREEEEVLDCLGSLFSNASGTTANSQQHSGIF